MKAMILAAGRGERMRPLTNKIPKALLTVGGKSLIVRHVEKLVAAGFSEVIINHAHLGALIEDALGDGSSLGAAIAYSRESTALETAGGIAQALPLLGEAPFAVVNADVYSEFDYAALADACRRLRQTDLLAHLVLVANPAHHPAGDFALHAERAAIEGERYTFSGIAAYRSDMFRSIARGATAKLAPLLREHIAAQCVSGELYKGRWSDIGTPERLAAIDGMLAAQ